MKYQNKPTVFAVPQGEDVYVCNNVGNNTYNDMIKVSYVANQPKNVFCMIKFLDLISRNLQLITNNSDLSAGEIAAL